MHFAQQMSPVCLTYLFPFAILNPVSSHFPDDQFYRQMNVRFRALLAFDQLMKHIKRIVRFVQAPPAAPL